MVPRQSRRATNALAGAWALLLAVGCQPETVTEARDQLARGGARTIEVRIPVEVDTVRIDEFLPEDVDTVVDGVFGVTLDPQLFIVPVVSSFLVPVEFTTAAVDFGDFESAMEDAVVNDARARLIMTNDSAQQVLLDDVVVGVVELNPNGSVPLVGSLPRYDTTAAGAPRSIAIADPGDTLVTVAGASSKTLEFDADIVVDGIVDLVLAGSRGAVVVTGSGTGGGFPISFLSSRIELVVLLDLTLPATGVEFTSNATQAGAKISQADADQVAERVTLAAFEVSAVNGTPFAADLAFAFVEGDLGDADVFTVPGAVVVTSDPVEGAGVGPGGIVTAPVSSTISVGLTGPQTRPLLGDQFTARTRIRLRPSAASSGRAILRPGDVLSFTALVAISIRAGADQ